MFRIVTKYPALLGSLVLIFGFILATDCRAQQDPNTVLVFDFNDHTYREAQNQVTVKPSGSFLVEDRFGNERSAAYINGHRTSYLNLGTSPLLKAKTISISLWVNLSRRVYSGKGYQSNPIFVIKNGPGDDFNVAYHLAYDGYNERFCATATQDSTHEAIINSVNVVEFSKWYHLVMTSDNREFALYVNGNLQGKCRKDFETKFLEGDSLVIGHSASKKNERFAQGSFDDIRIYHRVLNEEEIKELYNAPDPNKTKLVLVEALRWTLVAASVFIAAFLLVWQRRRSLKRSREKLDIKRKFHEMEIRTLKAQMNPHFIFNSLNSIQHFIMKNENAKAELYLSTFSKLIRELLESNTNENLTVANEVEILKGYLEMESLRFGKSFSFFIEVSNELDDKRLRVPHMMIQPFVENAIWHGLLAKSGDRSLHIRFSSDTEKTIACTVDDNGVGRNESMKKRSVSGKKSLALSFVRQRLELMREALNVECSVRIIDKVDADGTSLGTIVKIILPILN